MPKKTPPIQSEEARLAVDLSEKSTAIAAATKKMKLVPPVIKSMVDYTKATDAASELTINLKNATTVLKYYIDPKMQEVKATKALFQEFMGPAEELLAQVKDRMKVFLVAEQGRRDAEQLKLDQEAVANAPDDTSVVSVPVVNNIKTQHGALGTSTGRKIKKWRVLDETKIPRQYLVVNEAEITKAMRLDIAIPGIEFYLDTSIAIRV